MISAENQFEGLLGPQFYELSVKRSDYLLFAFFILWTQHINRGRVILQKLFSLTFGVFLDSNLVSRIMLDLEVNNAPKKRVQQLKIELVSDHHTNFSRADANSEGINLPSSPKVMMKQTAKQNLVLFNQISDEQQDAMLDTMHQVASGQTLYDIQEQNSTMRPFQGLRHFGRKVGNWLVRAVNFFDAIAIAIDEKMIRKAFDPDLGKNSTFSSHYVSRYRSYLPSLMVEVAGLIRPGRLAQIVAHFFPSPQKRMLKGRRQPLRKDEYLLSFLSELHKLYGHLPLLADANYATQKLVSWLVDKKWPFVMRLNSRKAILKPIKVKFENNSVLKFVDEWIFNEEYGGFVRVLAYRRMWKDARNPKFKYKTYYWITNLDWGSHSIVELYRSRWCLENSFKALKLLDKTPGLNVDLICGYFAMTFHVMGSLCYELRSSTKTLSRLMSLELSLTRTEKTVEMCWNDIPTRFARKLLLWVYYRPLLVKSISLVI